MNDPSPAIADLQARWHTLRDPDRALAILPIIRSGVSGRRLAPMLNCTPSLLHRLIRCIQAAPEDLELARQCKISTNELERRATRAKALRDASHQEVQILKRLEKAAKGAQDILRWLESDPAAAGNAEQVAQEARFMLNLAEQTGGLPPGTAPVGMQIKEIIQLTRPIELKDDGVDVGWFAKWLALWTFYAYPDRSVLWGAMDQALSRVQSRYWMSSL